MWESREWLWETVVQTLVMKKKECMDRCTKRRHITEVRNVENGFNHIESTFSCVYGLNSLTELYLGAISKFKIPPADIYIRHSGFSFTYYKYIEKVKVPSEIIR